MLTSLRNATALILGLPVISWAVAWTEWWTLLPFRVLNLGWQHKKASIAIIILMIMSTFFHDHTNTISFHGFGPIRFVLIGLMNFFWGIIDSVLHFGADVMSIPQKLDGPPTKDLAHLVGCIIGTYVMLYWWCTIETLMYWMLNHVLSPELLWGIVVVGVVYKQILPGGNGGSHSAPKKLASAPSH